ncbi:MAG: 1-deoxy-D-xylulose-5-phosphate reductoisomerase [Candidatus Thiodiazotropha lotti]|uniref:1-deoxy-D-xylulose 5-phosphate reductoisomerase n=1 Tax=Candidatus Thiodiazotropha lotti TaxID=2792787 RepID=A0A9E4K3X6_9GAMM|nr:1-deoxy-D-xylulose-5-phosphate reductoisomerase [Candidatus Thiodiazotropha lotti]ODC00730.1 1-deoxy-D-xylulose-5-phosphate reductoisomerase [Candidatus Thiodiazotropha endoloripes]MCG7928439.1 1-deoxy-D-xylulose-5-phosphate reductoisomerase [Candidatus Thiodiazotropha lotti]MCG7938310.1 1-deoxy-D-xylulose-5-phosphate reductoisomerase [Candidatus Thiodiazotropha lotti]MCG7985879.1 1-deoxy-D-xylulose-5-phosphate reductoisomerase [Candidatus Thiodiazotropha lotti]
MIGLTILGSTGSIGISTLDVVARHPDEYQVVALTANRDVEGLLSQCERFQPKIAVMGDPHCADQLAKGLNQRGLPIEVLSGLRGLEIAAAMPQAHYVMAAIVGAAGLLPALAAVRAGKRLLLANKEALVVAGDLFMQEVKAHNALVLPIDSEHNAVFQCMPEDYQGNLAQSGVKRILLTASGGPFRETPVEALHDVTPDQACAHPNWEMGRKISVDSATMMNKGLEVIEAHWLFQAGADKIEVVLHPQSVIHSMVEYEDGSVLAQLGQPDMRTPIAHALAWPKRIQSGVESLDLFQIGRLDFEPPDPQRFPCLGLAYQAIQSGGTASAVLNAANEVAVDAFLNQRLGFTGIAEVVEETMQQQPVEQVTDLQSLLEADQKARNMAEQVVQKRVSSCGIS